VAGVPGGIQWTTAVIRRRQLEYAKNMEKYAFLAFVIQMRGKYIISPLRDPRSVRELDPTSSHTF
jgi:hypothetical protein